MHSISANKRGNMGWGNLRLAMVIGTCGVIAAVFQNCTNAKFQMIDDDSVARLCGTQSCSLNPLTKKPAVTTILLALGDEANSKLVGNPVSNQYLAETVIRFSTPQINPKILIVRALNNHGEDPEDTVYIQNLLKRYSADLINEPASGIKPADVAGYDLVWFNNPGYPFSSAVSFDTLKTFGGGVVLQGDDLSRAETFSMSDLTGLKYIDNGTSVVCAGRTYPHDNNSGEQYRVGLDPARVQGLGSAEISFRYGNDIDNTEILDPSIEVLATAIGGPAACTEERPVVVRRER